MKQQEYNTIHKWVSYNFSKTGQCSSCPKNNLSGHKIHWANISGKYMRDIKDWIELCASCHQKFDQRYKPAYFFAVCMNCNDIFSLSPSRIGKKLFCSRSCYSKARIGRKKNLGFRMEVM